MNICEDNYIGVYATCRDCDSTVSHYTCNRPLIKVRPEAAEWDWWSACDNPECTNHYGEGIFQHRPDWEVSLLAPSKDDEYHGVIATRPGWENMKQIPILHLVVYKDKPSYFDMESLKHELETDEELGMVGEDFVLTYLTNDIKTQIQDLFDAGVQALKDNDNV